VESGETPDDLAWLYDVLDQVRDVGKWPIPHLSEQKEHPVSHVQLVVHPLFTVFMDMNWNPDLWKESGQNPDKYIEAHALAAARDVRRILAEDKEVLPMHYFYVKELIDEIDALRTPPPQGTLRVLDLSRRSLIADDGRREAYDSFLRTIATERTVCIDSYEKGTGRIQEKDLRMLFACLSPDAEIGVQGGYLHGSCIGAACQSLQKEMKSAGGNQKVFIDTRPSSDSTNIFRNTPGFVPSDKNPAALVYGPKERQELSAQISTSPFPEDAKKALVELYSAHVRPPKSVQSIEDLRTWIKDNADINEKYAAYTRWKQHFALDETEQKNINVR
jgi:hypothetical protein